MPVASLQDVCLAFGHVTLLDHVQLVLQPGERVALIGRNGSGKSSLLRILAGQVGADDGEVWQESGLRAALVPQEPDFDAAHTVFQAAVAGAGAMAGVLGEYHALLAQGERADMDRLHTLQQAIEHGDGWRLDARVERMLAELGLTAGAAVTTLSGGAQKRLALARALVQEPDLLLLDEPTNHLDIDGIRWLEGLLAVFGGTVLLITHDRRFLDAVATRIIELDRGRLASFPGNYARYVERKADALEAEAKADARFDKLLAQEEVWIRKGIEARRTRNMGRVARLEHLRRERAERRERVGRVQLDVERGEASGRLVAELEGVTKRFGERPVVRDFSTRILRGDKIGLIGPNGVGKSTLIRLILGELPPDGGRVRLGTRLNVAYFDQMRAQLDENATLAEVISPGSDYVERNGQRQHVIGYLGDFLFAPERARSPVRTLSGGERNRLLLARLFARPANLIVLDEPTNDLDIETLELLEALLQDFDGTVLLVSHDRAFLDNVVTQTLAWEGEGRWKEYVGGYTDWESQRPAPAPAEAPKSGRPAAVPTAPAAAVKAAAPAPERPTVVKLSFKEKRELEELPGRIDALETEQRELAARLADPDLYRQGAEAVRAANERAAAVEQALADAFVRWEALEAKAEQARS